MADGILGLGSSTSGVSLDQSIIDDLKAAEEVAYLDPITTDIEETNAEIDALDDISSKLTEILDVVELFDLYSSDTNVFDEVVATTSGDSATFDAADTSSLNPGTINVSVSQLAQKDVYQSDIISDTEATMDSGVLTITIADTTTEYDTTGLTYDDLLTELSYNSSLDVSLEQVSDEEYRLVIKSAESGLENAITISQSGDLELGYDNVDNHVLTSQNFQGSIDGIDYDRSSNKITMGNGLIISAIEEGDSSISIEKDDSYILEQVELIATIYNELVDLVDSYTRYDDDEESLAVISDSSTIDSIMSDIKYMFFDDYGLDDENNILAFGLSFDSDGYMEIDDSTFSDALTDNYDDLKEIFVGYAEKEGIGTRLSSYLDALDGYDGTITTYEDKLDDSVDSLEEEYEEESERLDEKYALMAQQFADYTVIISQMESDFAALDAIINSDD